MTVKARKSKEKVKQLLKLDILVIQYRGLTLKHTVMYNKGKHIQHLQ